MIRKIAVVAAALSLLFTGAAGADDQSADCHKTCVKALYPPVPPTKIVKVVKTVEKIKIVENVRTVENVRNVENIRNVQDVRGVQAVQKVQKNVQAKQGQLPKTGAESLPFAQIGAGLLAIGAMLVLLERNRRAAQSQHADIS